jgi:hypothetical protein
VRRELPQAAMVLLDEVYRHSYRVLVSYAYRWLDHYGVPGDLSVEAEDVVSDAAALLLDYIQSQTCAHPVPTSEEHMRRRLLVTVRYTAKRRYYAKAKTASQLAGRRVVRLGTPVADGSTKTWEAPAPPLVLPLAARDDLVRQRVRAALRIMSPRMCSMLVWHHACGLDLAAVAALAGRTPHGAAIALTHCRARFAELYDRRAVRAAMRKPATAGRSRTLAILAQCAAQPA